MVIAAIHRNGEEGDAYILAPEAVRNISDICQFVMLSWERMTPGS